MKPRRALGPFVRALHASDAPVPLPALSDRTEAGFPPPAPAPALACRHCGETAPDVLFTGDGPVVCASCVAHLAGAAAHPLDLDTDELWSLIGQHGDVVRLATVWLGERVEIVWQWREDGVR